MKREIEFKTPSRKEQETILTYDNYTHQWSIYSDVQKHIRRLEPLINKNDNYVIGKHEGKVTMIDGELSDQGLIVFMHKPKLSPEQIARSKQNLEKYRNEH